MIFSERDVTFLKLLCWCQYTRPEDLTGLISETELDYMIHMKLARHHKKSETLVLTRKGLSFLSGLLDGRLPTISQSYHEDAIMRRLRLSKLLLTAYRASVDVFTTTADELSSTPSMFLSAVTRRRGLNPWGSTRVAALTHLGDLFCAVHYVFPNAGRIALLDELTSYSNQAARFRGTRQAFIFAGDSYESILTELERPEGDLDSKLLYYGDAYRSLNLPVHLLSCDDTGAIQLRLMSVPDYRKKLTRAALQEEFVEAPGDIPEWDALFQGVPFVMAADMDLRRIDTAIRIASANGYRQIGMAALADQIKTVLADRYVNTGLSRIYRLSDSALEAVVGAPPVLHSPPRTQFLTEKGDVVDAPPFQTHRKAGGSG